MSIKDIVKDNFVEFVRYEFDSPNDYHENLSDSEEHSFDYYYDQTLWFKRNDGGMVQVPAEGKEGSVYYRVIDDEGEKVHDFKIPFPEMRGGRFKAQDRAIYFMRWIRKSMRE
jgi:hypothetical protein